MITSMARGLLLCLMVVALAACGGSGGGGGGGTPTDPNNPGNPNNPDNPDNPDDPDNPDNPDNPDDPDDPDNPDNPDDPDEPTPEEEAELLTLIDSNNHFTASVCPGALIDSNLGDAIDVLTCQNEALENISLSNDNLLGLLCANAVADTESGLLGSATNPDFLQACVLESGTYLKNTITGLLDGTSPVTQALCPANSQDADGNPVTCLVEVLQSAPNTLQDVVGLLGCEDMMNPQTCLTGVANNLASGELLLGTVNTVSMALCPVATNASEFNPQACLTEVLGAVTTVVGLGGNCEDGENQLTCLLDIGEGLGPIADAVGGIPVLGDLLGGLLEGGLPLPGDGSDPLTGLLENLGMLGDLTGEIPVLGDIIGGILNGDIGGDGGLPLDLEGLLGGLSGGDLEAVTGLLDQVPVLGDVLEQVLGALTCESGNPLSCLAGAGDQLSGLTGLLGEIPVLGDVLDPLLATLLGLADGGLGGGEGNPLDMLTGALDQIPVLGDLLNQLLGTLGGGLPGGDGGFEPDLSLLENIPVLGDLLTGLLGGALGGDLDLDGLLGGVLDGPVGDGGALVPTVGDLLEQIPALGDPLAGLLETLTGNDESLLKQLLSPIEDALQDVPVLGDLLSSLLDLLFGWT